MNDSYIRDYILNVLNNVFSDDLERIKALYYGLEDTLNGMQYVSETEQDVYTCNRLTTCLITLKEIIKENEK